MNCSESDREYLKTLSVMYVEDDKETRICIERILRPRVGTLVSAVNGAEGFDLFTAQHPDIVITDILMPVMDGLSMAQKIRQVNQNVPIVVITAFEQTDYLLRSIDIGVDRYVIKPVMIERLMVALADCAHRLFTEERIRHLALHDALTDLPNRTLLKERLKMACATADRNSQQVAMIFIDLDRFKAINDSHGHIVGDQVLQEVAGRLTGLLRSVDTVCRLSGDEFLVVITGVTSRADITCTADRVVKTLNAEMTIDGTPLTITPSVGIAVYPEDGADMEALIHNSDSAMYRAKQQGGNSYSFFSPSATGTDGDSF
jgi:diguanylate cyclase (GGDEF)-like protein